MSAEMVQNFFCPSILVVITFLFNLFVNKKVRGMAILYSVLSLPKELMLLAMGFSILILFDDVNIGIIILLLSIVFAIVVYALYQGAKDFLESSSGINNTIKKWIPLIVRTFCSYIISGAFYVWTIYECLKGVKA